ncbi:MAG TPA: rod shape-determining protein MreD [bacterium]|nr:rod shape-determining protein MreD [bacterium]
MRIWRILLFAVIVLFLQVWIGPAFRNLGAEPNFVLLLVIFVSCSHDPLHGMLLGFTLGMAEDVLRMQCFGLSALTYVLVGYLPRVLGNLLFLENRVAQFIYLILAHLLKIVLEGTVESALTHSLPEHNVFLLQRLLSLVLDAILLPLLFFVWFRTIAAKENPTQQTRTWRSVAPRR